MWDDSVAPEITVDFDAPQIPGSVVLKSFAIAMGCLAGLYQLIKYYDPVAHSPVAPRTAVLDMEEFKYAMGMTPREE